MRFLDSGDAVGRPSERRIVESERAQRMTFDLTLTARPCQRKRLFAQPP
jgi:hypothetical protein